MASRPKEASSLNRPKEASSLNRPKEASSLNRPKELSKPNQPKELTNLNLRPVENRSIELENQNFNISNRDSVDSSSSSDVQPETTLFEQIAVQIHSYKSNFNYFQRLPGILNLLEIFFGLLTFILILIACNNYYDPWMGIVVSGFAGGKVEVFFFLCCSYGLITTSIFALLILISNSYEKTLNAGNFYFIISFALFAFLMFSSILLLIELSNRNTGILEVEHHFFGKVSCAILGILNSIFYLLSSSIAFKIPSSHESKRTIPQQI